MIELLADEGRDVLGELFCPVRDFFFNQRPHGSFDDSAIVGVQPKADVVAPPFEVTPLPRSQRCPRDDDYDHDRDGEQMNPRCGFVSLWGEKAGGIDPAWQPKTEQIGYQETGAKEKMDKPNDRRFACNERAAPDRLITLKESLEIHARHSTGGQKQPPQMKHDFPPRNHQGCGNGEPVDAEAADNIR